MIRFELSYYFHDGLHLMVFKGKEEHAILARPCVGVELRLCLDSLTTCPLHLGIALYACILDRADYFIVGCLRIYNEHHFHIIHPLCDDISCYGKVIRLSSRS
jgi:hypothetical protein